MAALDVAEDGAAGATEEDCVAGGVDDRVGALVRVEAEEEGNGGVAEDVDVGEVKEEGAAGSVGGGDAQGELSDGGRDVVAEGVAGGGGFEGVSGDLWVTAEPRIPDDVAGGANVGFCGGDVGLGRGVWSLARAASSCGLEWEAPERRGAANHSPRTVSRILWASMAAVW